MMRKTPLEVVFFRSNAGTEPVRDWLKKLPKEDRKAIGKDIKTAQYGWPLGMPLVKKVDKDLWEIRSHLENRISRVLLTMIEEKFVLLHGFIKKTQKIPKNDIVIAKKRLSLLRSSS
jgi:phage-related protein